MTLTPREDKVLWSLDPDIGLLVRDYLGRPPDSRDQLAARIDAYLVRIQNEGATHTEVNVAAAKEVATACRRLVERLTDQAPDEARRLVSAAVWYFAEVADAEPDTASLTGFDDDLQVVHLVEEALQERV